jgi:hypothetical protein
MTIERIPTNTSEAIVAFYKLQPASLSFTLEDLFNYIEAFGFGTSRETIKRSLRNLRQDGKINYSIHNRSKGTLMVRPLATATTEVTPQNEN